MLRHVEKGRRDFLALNSSIQINIAADLHMGKLVNNYVIVVPARFLASPCMPLEPINFFSKCYNYYYIISIKKTLCMCLHVQKVFSIWNIIDGFSAKRQSKNKYYKFTRWTLMATSHRRAT